MSARKDTLDEQVSFRIATPTRQFYEQRAEQERRKLSDVLRLALEDHAALLTAYQERQSKRGKPRTLKEEFFG